MSSAEFTSDGDALELLSKSGHREVANGVIRGDWRTFDAKCRAAVQYLCDEWDFVFEHTTKELGRFRRWLDGKSGRYEYEHCRGCALAQFLRDEGLDTVLVASESYTFAGHEYPIPKLLDEHLRTARTFEQLRALMDRKPIATRGERSNGTVQ